MTFKEFVPAGTPGSTVLAAGTNLYQVTTTDTDADSTITYSSAAGCGRDSVGVALSAPDTVDILRVTLQNTSDVAGKGRIYGYLPEIPAGTGFASFFRLANGAGTQVIRFAVACQSHPSLTPGTLQVQNSAGGTLANGPVLATDTVYQFVLGAQPGATTSTGKARAEVYSDTDTLLFRLANTSSGVDVAVTGGNIDAVNMGTTQSIGYASAGKIDGSGGAPVSLSFTRLALDTSSAIPASLPLVDKLTTTPPTVTGGADELIWVGDAWR